MSIFSGSSSGTCFSRRRGQGGSLVASHPASHCEHTAAAAPSFASSGPRMEGTRSGESSTRSTSSCDSGLWAAMHSSAMACSAGLSEHSRAARSASTSCGSWPSRRLSRLEGMTACGRRQVRRLDRSVCASAASLFSPRARALHGALNADMFAKFAITFCSSSPSPARTSSRAPPRSSRTARARAPHPRAARPCP